MLDLKDFTVKIGENTVISKMNLCIPEGQLHIIMGPNGSGKSTLTQAIAGNPAYVAEGHLSYRGHDLTLLSPQERAHLGIFVAFQNPVVIPGVSLITFLKTIVNAHRKARGEETLDAADFLTQARNCAELVGLDESFLYRNCHEGFSGGEKKRAELLQILLLEPSFIILDETDSGLDRDAFTLLVELINRLRNQNRTWLVITHYDHFLEALQPDCVHVLWKGMLIEQGSPHAVKEQLRVGGYQGLASRKGVLES